MKPKNPYSKNKTLVYVPEVLKEALSVLAADNKSKRKKGDNFSALTAHLGLKYATQPEKMIALRQAGFRRLEELLALK